MFGALSSLVAGVFVENSTALNVFIWPLFISMPFVIFPPLMAKGCPSCNENFFGSWLSIDLHTSRCKHCDQTL